ncbi:hypothetical protein HS088_TW03G00732 [Tripterygium wilfordii]|uniref:ubiquitinyl hydrolase 1 n=1 Tax=Tripterygium wilfordii TaxID=458696 RepID=A0A7J7DWC0_TRIWF|nr:OVARIAN TUMOR DOMAIN-containing deubiquitinating enzyme 10-like isoform X2 [Tripterygium wilfordii]KAF5750396.1 hypothetical protein HS088_TW03G00732 [Tripterygium wilfordii]
MIPYEQESDVVQWGLRLLDGDPPYYSGYYGDAIQHETEDNYHGQYARGHYDLTDCSQVENDEMIARALQEEISQLEITESSGYSAAEEQSEASNHMHDWHSPLARNDWSGTQDHECGLEENDDMPSSSCSSPVDGEECSSNWDSDEFQLDDEVGKRLNQMNSIPHVPRINGEIPSIDEATSDHERLLTRLQCYGFVELKVQGDGNCQFRALSDQLYDTLERHKFVRRQVVNQLKSHPEIYEGYVPMEYNDYLKKMSKSGEWGDHVTLQAAADAYGVKIFVMTSFKDTCYIEILPNKKSKRNLDTSSSESRRRKKWWIFGNKH